MYFFKAKLRKFNYYFDGENVLLDSSHVRMSKR